MRLTASMAPTAATAASTTRPMATGMATPYF
jgi:hypothetical protein